MGRDQRPSNSSASGGQFSRVRRAMKSTVTPSAAREAGAVSAAPRESHNAERRTNERVKARRRPFFLPTARKRGPMPVESSSESEDSTESVDDAGAIKDQMLQRQRDESFDFSILYRGRTKRRLPPPDSPELVQTAKQKKRRRRPTEAKQGEAKPRTPKGLKWLGSPRIEQNREYFKSFEWDSTTYKEGDTVFAKADVGEPNYIAVLCEAWRDDEGGHFRGRWLYRPEDIGVPVAAFQGELFLSNNFDDNNISVLSGHVPLRSTPGQDEASGEAGYFYARMYDEDARRPEPLKLSKDWARALPG